RQRDRDEMVPWRLAGEDRGDDLAPPLQPDLTQHRLGYGLAHPRDLVIEGIKRQQRLAPFRRREQRRLKPVAVMAAEQRSQRQDAFNHLGTRTPLARFSGHNILPSRRSRSATP